MLLITTTTTTTTTIIIIIITTLNPKCCATQSGHALARMGTLKLIPPLFRIFSGRKQHYMNITGEGNELVAGAKGVGISS